MRRTLAETMLARVRRFAWLLKRCLQQRLHQNSIVWQFCKQPFFSKLDIDIYSSSTSYSTTSTNSSCKYPWKKYMDCSSQINVSHHIKHNFIMLHFLSAFYLMQLDMIASFYLEVQNSKYGPLNSIIAIRQAKKILFPY